MFGKQDKNRIKTIILLILVFSLGGFVLGEEINPLVLQEMTWTDVRDYLKTSDMVIIPIGSTEQHGPHLPLGTDYYEAFGLTKMISAKAKVIVAPVVLAGYSYYHSGFPGSLSLKPETLEQVLFETAEMLMKYGFCRFMFFNYHGGNKVSEMNVIHRINHSTEATALSIGIGSPVQPPGREIAPFDQHAGVGETSLMLFLRPDLVKMERAEKPKITYTKKMQKIISLGQKNQSLMSILGTLLAVPEETNKGGASHELSSNGIWTFGDPRDATRELGDKRVKEIVNNAVRFIEAWRKIK